MFFSSWEDLGRVALVGTLAYVALVLFLRVSGTRTLSKMNAFDFVVTVALGSTLATVLLSKDVPLAEGAAGLGLLVLLQYIATWLSVRWPPFGRLLKADPTLLYHRGRFLDRAMRRQRIRRDEILSAARQQGIGDLGEVEAVVLETTGEVSFVRRGREGADASTLGNVPRLDGGSGSPES